MGGGGAVAGHALVQRHRASDGRWTDRRAMDRQTDRRVNTTHCHCVTVEANRHTHTQICKVTVVTPIPHPPPFPDSRQHFHQQYSLIIIFIPPIIPGGGGWTLLALASRPRLPLCCRPFPVCQLWIGGCGGQ